MASLPPQAARSHGEAEDADGAASDPPASRAGLPAAATIRNGGSERPAGPYRAFPNVTPSSAPVELSLDLRGTPPDKVLSRLFGALERVSDDVTLLVHLRDTPEYAGVVASAFQALRHRGYASDSSRFPGGGQRMRIYRRRGAPRPVQRQQEDEPLYVPAPPPLEGDSGTR